MASFPIRKLFLYDPFGALNSMDQTPCPYPKALFTQVALVTRLGEDGQTIKPSVTSKSLSHQGYEVDKNPSTFRTTEGDGILNNF